MHIPRKRFGQHFLHDKSVIERIIHALAPLTADHMIEIGPGLGALTYPLLPHLTHLEVIELDRDLIPALQKNKQLTVHAADALTVDFNILKRDDRPLRIVGNLPYNISTPLIFHLLTFTPIIKDMYFMLQKEVADRLSAAPNTDHYGRLSVMVQYHCEVEVLFDVSPDSFSPPPKVQSSVIRLLPLPAPLLKAEDEALFADVVKQAFSQRRKTLRNSLKNLVDDKRWKNIPLAPSARAETLSVQDFVMISNILKASS